MTGTQTRLRAKSSELSECIAHNQQTWPGGGERHQLSPDDGDAATPNDPREGPSSTPRRRINMASDLLFYFSFLLCVCWRRWMRFTLSLLSNHTPRLISKLVVSSAQSSVRRFRLLENCLLPVWFCCWFYRPSDNGQGNYSLLLLPMVFIECIFNPNCFKYWFIAGW